MLFHQRYRRASWFEAPASSGPPGDWFKGVPGEWHVQRPGAIKPAEGGPKCGRSGGPVIRVTEDDVKQANDHIKTLVERHSPATVAPLPRSVSSGGAGAEHASPIVIDIT